MGHARRRYGFDEVEVHVRGQRLEERPSAAEQDRHLNPSNAWLGVSPANAPWRNRLSMNAVTSWVSAFHSGVELPSNTAQVRLA